MNTQETTQILARLTATLRVNPPMTAELFSVWQDHLRDVKFIDAAEAVDQTINAATFMPPISDFRAQCKRNARHRQLQESHQEVVRALDRPVGIHTHDDAGLAVADAMAAVAEGARQVQGTINGYGERCGNANLCTLIPNLVLKCGYTCNAGAHLKELTALSRAVSEICNLSPIPGAPYVGPNAFAHKGGVHASAVMRNARTYEHVPPEVVGNAREVVVSELSGRSNLAYKARELGLRELSEEERGQLLARVKELEFQGYQFEGAEASFELLARRMQPGYRPLFEPVSYTVSVMGRTGRGTEVEATVRVRVGGQLLHTAADGDGPVNAQDRALRKALQGPYPEIAEMHLVDYKVRVIDGRDGTASRVRVLITTRSPRGYWTTVGVSDNILDASWLGLVDSLEYGLLRHRATGAEAAAVAGRSGPVL